MGCSMGGRGCATSAVAVDVGSVLDAHDANGVVVGNDSIDDAVGTASSRVITVQLTKEWPTDPVGLLAERADHELDDRRGDPCGESGQ